jgi:hypothetical protein
MLQDSSARDSANRKVTTAASNHSPIAAAPNTAIVIRRFISGRNRLTDIQALGAMNHPPATMPAR